MSPGAFRRSQLLCYLHSWTARPNWLVWLHRTVAGPAAPGYRRLEIRPRPGGGLTRVAARHLTPYGLAASNWRVADGAITVEAVVPPNTTARLTLPGRETEPVEVGSGTHRWSDPFGLEASPAPPALA